jgi:hypothetical protein
MPQTWDGKNWVMKLEDPRNRIPVADVFVAGATFQLIGPTNGTYTMEEIVRGKAGRTLGAWSQCVLTPVGSTPLPVAEDKDRYDLEDDPKDDNFANQCRARFRNIDVAAECLVGRLRVHDTQCDIKMYQIEKLLKHSTGKHDLLIIHVHVPYGRLLNDGSGYGHS